jgi:hypothetical protein
MHVAPPPRARGHCPSQAVGTPPHGTVRAGTSRVPWPGPWVVYRIHPVPVRICAPLPLRLRMDEVPVRGPRLRTPAELWLSRAQCKPGGRGGPTLREAARAPAAGTVHSRAILGAVPDRARQRRHPGIRRSIGRAARGLPGSIQSALLRSGGWSSACLGRGPRGRTRPPSGQSGARSGAVAGAPLRAHARRAPWERSAGPNRPCGPSLALRPPPHPSPHPGRGRAGGHGSTAAGRLRLLFHRTAPSGGCSTAWTGPAGAPRILRAHHCTSRRG